MKNENIERIRKQYPAGTQVQMIYMEGELQMKKGLKGIVQKVDDIGQIHVKWENGSTLAINLKRDIVAVLKAGL